MTTTDPTAPRLDNLPAWIRRGDEAAGDDIRAGHWCGKPSVDVLAHLGLMLTDYPDADPAELRAAQDAALAAYCARMEHDA